MEQVDQALWLHPVPQAACGVRCTASTLDLDPVHDLRASVCGRQAGRHAGPPLQPGHDGAEHDEARPAGYSRGEYGPAELDQEHARRAEGHARRDAGRQAAGRVEHLSRCPWTTPRAMRLASQPAANAGAGPALRAGSFELEQDGRCFPGCLQAGQGRDLDQRVCAWPFLEHRSAGDAVCSGAVA